MAFYPCNIGGDGVKRVEYLTETEFDSLIQKDSNVLYMVTKDVGRMVIKKYIGNKRLYKYPQFKDNTLYYDDLFFPSYVTTNSSKPETYLVNYEIETGYDLFNQANGYINFEIAWKFRRIDSQSNLGEQVILGSKRQQGGSYINAFELYYNNSKNLSFYYNGSDILSHVLTDNDLQKEIKFTFIYNELTINYTISLYIDDILVNSVNRQINLNDPIIQNPSLIGNYRDGYGNTSMFEYIRLNILD